MQSLLTFNWNMQDDLHLFSKESLTHLCPQFYNFSHSTKIPAELHNDVLKFFISVKYGATAQIFKHIFAFFFKANPIFLPIKAGPEVWLLLSMLNIAAHQQVSVCAEMRAELSHSFVSFLTVQCHGSHYETPCFFHICLSRSTLSGTALFHPFRVCILIFA